MIREVGEVIACEPGWVTIRTQLRQGCGGCQHNSHCGAGLLSKALPGRSRDLTVPMTNPPAPGAQVELLLPEQAMVRFSALVYLVPLLALTLGVALGTQLWPAHELPALVLGGLAFGLSFTGLRRWLRHRDLQVRTMLEVRPLGPTTSDNSGPTAG